MRNPYTIHQVAELNRIAPLGQLYSLADGTVEIDDVAAARFAAAERIDPPAFDMDDLTFWDRVLSTDEVEQAYAERFTPTIPELSESISTLTAAAWNIWHGGKHFTIDTDGWDSRMRIAEMIRAENVDVVMMQETYSSGDFIAAELGYYFATTADRDYLNQGSNISVLSRFPITELHVEDDSAFMNVGVKVAVSDTQDLYVMSNWYGMAQFPAVFDFHEARFQESDTIPTLFGGDFNDVPQSDGGDSPATPVLLDAGFADAFRETFPDAQAEPGFTHRSGRRIDQLYYKGAGLTNASTRVVSTWPGGFPSDHFMIVTSFDVDYSTPAGGR
jgi:endonuclease/exonuclease/phosphatase family metal-dependent hydrolase